MKKRFSALLSLLLAFVMCFALVACNDDGTGNGKPGGDGPNGGNETTIVTSAEANAAVRAFVTAEGYSGNLTLKADSKAGVGFTFSAQLAKLGDKMKFGVGSGAAAQAYIVDVKTGYVYSNSTGGHVYTQALPQGLIEYLVGFVDESETAFNTDRDFPEYDAETKTISDSVEYSAKINGYLNALYDAVKYNKPLSGFFDDCISLISGKDMSVADIRVLVRNALHLVKDSTVDQLKDAVAQMPVANEQLTKIVNSIPQSVIDRCGDRKIGEMIVGLYDYIAQMMPEESTLANDETDQPDDGEQVPPESGMQDIMGMLQGAVYAVLDAPVDISTFDEKLGALSSLLDVALAYKTADIVAYVTQSSPELKAFVDSRVTLKRYGASYTLKFDDNKTLIGLTAECGFSHSYNGEVSNDFTVLADNDYSIEVSFDVDWTVPAASEFELAFNAQYPVYPLVSAVADVNSNIPVTVYVELGGHNFDKVEKTGELILPNGNVISSVAVDTVVFDADTGILTIPAMTAPGIKIASGSQAIITLTFTSGTDSFDVTVSVLYLDHNADTVKSLLMQIIEYITGGEMPEDPDISVKPVE